MKRAGILLLLLAIMLSLSAGVSYASDSYVYATTNMTWAEFYAGEVGSASADLLSAGLDAISTPTTHGLARFPLILGESGDKGTTITGLKGVQVRMTQDVYNSLADNSRFTVSNGTFDEYKEVNADGSFGKMVSTSTDATSSGASVRLATGSSARWGHYVFSVSSADITIGSANRLCDYYLGALLETSDGKIYGMRHDNNLWSNTDLAFTVNANYTEPHGVGTKRYYQYTSDLEGKTVTKITYMLKDRPDVVLSNLNIYLKKRTDATIRPSQTFTPTSSDIAATLVFSNIPDGANYTLASVTKGSGRGATTLTSGTDYTYDSANKVLTILGGSEAINYVATFTSDEYADIAATIEVGNFHYATTDMTWAEFYAAEVGEPFSADLYSAGLDAISSPTSRVATRFTQLTSESNDIGGRSITGVAAVQVRMNDTVYNTLSNDSRYTFASDTFSEYKPVNANGSFGAMVTDYHNQDGATMSLTAPAVWGDYLLDIESIDITLGSGDTRYYLGALVETSDGKIYAMRHNNNLWFNAGDLAISTAEFVEVHGVSRSYKYTSDMEGKRVRKITYMLKNLPDEIVSCDVFLKLKTSASVSPVYDDGYHAVMAGMPVTLKFSGIPSDAGYSLSGVTFGTGRRRTAVTGCTMSGDVLIFAGDVSEGTYTATFSDETYANISATINVYTTNATDKIISADKNAAGLMFLLTPAGVSDSTDAVLDAQNFVNATDYTSVDVNYTENFTGARMIEGSGFTLDVTLNNVPSGKRGILGFSKNLEITPAKIGDNDFSAMSAKILALPDVAYGWRVPTEAQLRDMGLIVAGIYPDGVSRDITGYISSGLRVDGSTITFSYGTVLIDRVFTESEEGKVYALSDEGEGTMSDGAFDSKLTATWYVTTPGGSSSGGTDSDDRRPGTESDDRRPGTQSDDRRPGTDSGDRTPGTYAYTVTPGRPAVSLTDSKKAEILTALSLLSSKITSSTGISELPASAIKGAQSSATSDSNVIYLPIIEVSEDKIYVFGVSLDKFTSGDSIHWHSNAIVRATGDFLSAADEEEAAIFMNDSGNEVETVPANKHVNVAAYLEASNTYYPTITRTSSGGGTDGDEYGVGSSSGGCNPGITLPVLLLGLGFIIARKK